MYSTEFIIAKRRTFTPFALMWTAVGVYQSCLEQFHHPNFGQNYKNNSQIAMIADNHLPTCVIHDSLQTLLWVYFCISCFKNQSSTGLKSMFDTKAGA